MARPVLSMLRIRRMAEGLTIAQAARRAGINETDYGKVERLQSKPSRRVGQFLADHYREKLERLLSEVKA